MNFFDTYDVEKRGSIAFEDFKSFLSHLMLVLMIPLEEKHLLHLAKLIDVNKDNRYSQDEIVHVFSELEIKDYFES